MRLPAPPFSRSPHDVSGFHVPHVLRGFPRKVLVTIANPCTYTRMDERKGRVSIWLLFEAGLEREHTVLRGIYLMLGGRTHQKCQHKDG